MPSGDLLEQHSSWILMVGELTDGHSPSNTRPSCDHVVRTLGGPPSHYTRAVRIRAVPAQCVEGHGAHPFHELMPDVWDNAVPIPSTS